MNQVALGRDELMHSYVCWKRKKLTHYYAVHACIRVDMQWKKCMRPCRGIHTLLKYGGAQTLLFSKRSEPSHTDTAWGRIQILCILYGVQVKPYTEYDLVPQPQSGPVNFWAGGWEVQIRILLEALPRGIIAARGCFTRRTKEGAG